MRKLLALGVAVLVSASSAYAQVDNPSRSQDDRGDGARSSDGRDGEGRGGFRGFGPPPNPMFDAIDADKDGNITAAELEKAVAALKTLDKDGNGVITREEARPQFSRGGFGGGGDRGGFGGGFTAEGYAASMLQRDANKDGKLNAEELGERGARLLETSDANGDKLLDEAELKAAAERIRERFGNRSGDRDRSGGDGGNRPQRPEADDSGDRG